GGACASDAVQFGTIQHQYACGASVLGMMQDFVFEETGLSKRLQVYSPRHPDTVYFDEDDRPCFMYGNVEQLKQEVKEKWGESGDVAGFHRDLDRVADFLVKNYRNAAVPTLESAVDSLGEETTERWISGSARQLLDSYFTSDRMKIFHAMDVVES